MNDPSMGAIVRRFLYPVPIKSGIEGGVFCLEGNVCHIYALFIEYIEWEDQSMNCSQVVMVFITQNR